MNFRLLLPAFAALVLLAAACAAPPVLRNDQMLHDTSLVTGGNCEAPCWRGITPGETSWTDAIRIIENDPTLTDLQIQDDDESAAKLAVWQEADGQPCCQMFTEDGEVVQSIVLLVAPEIGLGKLLDTYGDPDYVVGTEVTDDQAVMNLFYLDPPVLVYVFVAGAAQGALSESSEIIGSLYVTQEDMQRLIEGNSLYAWDGYQSYSTYASGEFAVTAIPTAASEAGDE